LGYKTWPKEKAPQHNILLQVYMLKKHI